MSTIQTVFVTGSQGYVGRHLVVQLKGLGYEVIMHSRTKNTGKSDFPFIILDLNRINEKEVQQDLIHELKNVDVVIHCAGLAHKKYTSNEYDKINNQGSVTLAKCAEKANIKKFIYLSSVAVYGVNSSQKVLNENSLCNPCDNYGLSKLNAEKGLREQFYLSVMEIIIIRPPIVYGLNSPGNFSLLTKLVTKARINPFILVSNKRSMVSINNLTDFISNCVCRSKTVNGVYIPCDNSDYSTHELLTTYAEIFNINTIQLPIPKLMFKFVLWLASRPNLFNQVCENLLFESPNIKNNLEWVAPFDIKQSLTNMNKYNNDKL
jgi:UDP-glucose 4-epimerase